MFAILLFSCLAFSDIIVPNTHPVATYVRFVNTGDYPFAGFFLVHQPVSASTPPSRRPVLDSGWMSTDQGYKFDSQ